MTYTCPVCGYDELEEPPADFEICPSCGTEFELDDDLVSHVELRARWIAGGAGWWSTDNLPPPNWSAVQQLRRAGYELTDNDLVAIADTGLYTVGRVDLPETNTLRTIGMIPVAQRSFTLQPNFSASLSNALASGRKELARLVHS